ncbi:homoaconitate hydratase family protein [Candidatus Woesearchaeota archaeon]|nr:homoaconitate hydratase family protein [Candidatus Woesearchaeota archaeon]
MGMAITEKILAKHAGKEKVKPGELINAKIDTIMLHDITTTPAIDMLETHGMDRVFDPSKVVVTPDHFVPNKDIKSAEMVSRIRKWARKHKIMNFYDIGKHGVCHAILPEQGHVLPGMTIIAGDSHTCTHGALGAFSTGVGSTDIAAALYSGNLWFKVPPTIKFIINGKLPKGAYSKDIILTIIKDIGVGGALYKAMEFSGSAISGLSVEARMTITNMAIEAGGKNGVIEPDKKTLEYIKKRSKGKFEVVKSDNNAAYFEVKEYDASGFEPVVAFPDLPSNGKTMSEISKMEEIRIDQAYLGSCTNGRLEDLRIAAKILKGNKVAADTRMLIVPATTDVWKQAMEEGLFRTFSEAGAAVSTPTCGACLGGHMGVLAEGERCISSTNRNFVGRMGSPRSEVYLASPAAVAASAIEGKIADPRRYL